MRPRLKLEYNIKKLFSNLKIKECEKELLYLLSEYGEKKEVTLDQKY